MPPLRDTSATTSPGFTECPVCGNRRWRYADGRVLPCVTCERAAREGGGVTRPCGVCGRQLRVTGGQAEPCGHCAQVAALRDAHEARQAETVRRRRER